MPSVAFSTLNLAPLNHAALGAALGVGGPTNMLPDNHVGNIGGVAVPAILANIMPTILNMWNIDRSEANRRVYVDAFLNAVLVNWHAAVPAHLMITCEESIATSGARYGHGRLDYLISALMGVVAPFWSPALIIEAKLNLNHGGAATDYGEAQLIGEIVTARQLGNATGQAAGNHFLRGVLTDGRFWRFYEIDEVNGDIRRSPPIDATVALDLIRLIRTFRKFLFHYNAAGSQWI